MPLSIYFREKSPGKIDVHVDGCGLLAFTHHTHKQQQRQCDMQRLCFVSTTTTLLLRPTELGGVSSRRGET